MDVGAVTTHHTCQRHKRMEFIELKLQNGGEHKIEGSKKGRLGPGPDRRVGKDRDIEAGNHPSGKREREKLARRNEIMENVFEFSPR